MRSSQRDTPNDAAIEPTAVAKISRNMWSRACAALRSKATERSRCGIGFLSLLSVRVNPGGFDDAGPFRDLGAEERSESGRCLRIDHHPGIAQLLLDARLSQHGGRGVGEAMKHRLRRAHRR